MWYTICHRSVNFYRIHFESPSYSPECNWTNWRNWRTKSAEVMQHANNRMIRLLQTIEPLCRLHVMWRQLVSDHLASPTRGRSSGSVNNVAVWNVGNLWDCLFYRLSNQLGRRALVLSHHFDSVRNVALNCMKYEQFCYEIEEEKNLILKAPGFKTLNLP
jgi:hypothetical protein